MALVLPASIDYKQSNPALPDATQQINVSANPVNGGEFSQQQVITVDLLNRGFLIPDSLYISYSVDATATATATAMRGTPVYTPFSRLDIQFGSSTVESINQYNLVAHMLTNVHYTVAQKYGLMQAFGYDSNPASTTAVPTMEELDGRAVTASSVNSYSVAAPLPCLLSNAEKLIPLFAMSQVRLNFSIDSIQNMFTVAAGISDFKIKNFQLNYKIVDFGGAVESIVLGMGEKIYIKSQSFASSAQTVSASATGYNELIYNQRFASVKSLIAVNGSGAPNAVNGFMDSIDITSGNGEYQFRVGGISYPSRAISTKTCKTQALMELKQAVGSIYDKSNNMSINRVEYSYVANPNPTTTAFAPGKFYVGVSTEKLNSDSLLTGVSTQNSPISYVFSTSSALSSQATVCLITNYDALLEVDLLTRQASVKA